MNWSLSRSFKIRSVMSLGRLAPLEAFVSQPLRRVQTTPLAAIKFLTHRLANLGDRRRVAPQVWTSERCVSHLNDETI